MDTNTLKQYDDLFAGIAVVDRNQKIIYFNQAFLVLTQTSPRVIKGLDSFAKLFTTTESIDKIINKALKGETAISEELTLTTLAGHGPLTIIFKAIPIDSGHLLITTNDLTVERALYEKYRIQLEEIKRTHEKILQTDKLATLGELSAGISHEINNPLTVAYGYAQTIEWELKEKENVNTEELKVSMNRVTSSLEKISSIINNMKSYVRTDEDQREFCDLREVVKEACELTYTGLKKESLKLSINTPADPLLIQCNRIELEQVIVNLLKNSFDSVLDSKTIKPEIIITLARSDNMVSLSVQDNGPGIPSDSADKIFQPFYTTKDIGKGSGLGLSISKRLIEKHQGTLKLLPSGQGACFQFTLPTMEMSSMLTSGGFGPDIGGSGQKKILIVDDDAQVLNQLDSLLQEAGYSVIGSTGGEDALHILIQTEIDLIITDLHMPRLSGTDLSTKIRQIEEELPIIYLSGALDAQNIFEQDKDKLQIFDLLTKPFNEDRFLSCISKALENKK